MLNSGHPAPNDTPPSKPSHPLGRRPDVATDPLLAAAKRANVLASLDLERSRRRENHDDARLDRVERDIERIVETLCKLMTAAS